LLVTGGSGGSGSNSDGESWSTDTTVELWAPGSDDGVQCRLPDLPERMSYHSLDSLLVGDGSGNWMTVTCHERTCYKFSQGKWEFHRRTLQSRTCHTSAVFYTDTTVGNFMLAGGCEENNSTEIIPDDRDQDVDVTKGFGLQHQRRFHCSIQLDHDGFILTGGQFGNSNEVTEYSFRGGESSARDLAPLSIGRWGHACGTYTDHANGLKMLIVAGGRSAADSQLSLSSTEVMDYTGSGSWRQAGLLPTARWGLRGVSIGQDFYVTGGDAGVSTGWNDEILSWDPVGEAWTVAGHLLFPRANHGLAEVSIDSFTDYCINGGATVTTYLQPLLFLCFLSTVCNAMV